MKQNRLPTDLHGDCSTGSSFIATSPSGQSPLKFPLGEHAISKLLPPPRHEVTIQWSS